MFAARKDRKSQVRDGIADTAPGSHLGYRVAVGKREQPGSERKDFRILDLDVAVVQPYKLV